MDTDLYCPLSFIFLYTLLCVLHLDLWTLWPVVNKVQKYSEYMVNTWRCSLPLWEFRHREPFSRAFSDVLLSVLYSCWSLRLSVEDENEWTAVWRTCGFYSCKALSNRWDAHTHTPDILTVEMCTVCIPVCVFVRVSVTSSNIMSCSRPCLGGEWKKLKS